jgi:hypothetical protein
MSSLECTGRSIKVTKSTDVKWLQLHDKEFNLKLTPKKSIKANIMTRGLQIPTWTPTDASSLGDCCPVGDSCCPGEPSSSRSDFAFRARAPQNPYLASFKLFMEVYS